MNAPNFTPVIELVHKLTGCKGYTVEDDLIFKPEMLTKRFFDCLNEALTDTPFTYMVNRSLEVTVFKP